MNLPRHLLWGIGALFLLVCVGTVGYMVIEDWSFSDSIYMTIITISTVGYREVHDLDSAGRAFTIFLLIAGVGLALYILTGVVQNLIEQGVQGIFRRRRENGEQDFQAEGPLHSLRLWPGGEGGSRRPFRE